MYQWARHKLFGNYIKNILEFSSVPYYRLRNESELCLKHYQRQKYSKKLYQSLLVFMWYIILLIFFITHVWKDEPIKFFLILGTMFC